MRIALFVDGNNLYGAQKELGWTVEFSKLISFASADGQLIDATYFAPTTSKTNPHIASMISRAGFSVISKPAIEDKSSGEVYKANMDIELAANVILSMPIYDKAVLVTGDGDFEYILSILRTHGKLFTIISTKAIASRQLKNSAGMHFIDMADHRDALEYVATVSETPSDTDQPPKGRIKILEKVRALPTQNDLDSKRVKHISIRIFRVVSVWIW